MLLISQSLCHWTDERRRPAISDALPEPVPPFRCCNKLHVSPTVGLTRDPSFSLQTTHSTLLLTFPGHYSSIEPAVTSLVVHR